MSWRVFKEQATDKNSFENWNRYYDPDMGCEGPVAASGLGYARLSLDEKAE